MNEKKKSPPPTKGGGGGRHKGRHLKIALRCDILRQKVHLNFRKRGGVQKSMGNKVPWKTGMLMYLPVTLRPLIALQKEACYHLVTSRKPI